MDIDAETGEPFDLVWTDDLMEELGRHAAAGCIHPAKEIRRAIVAGGGIQFRPQCLACGELVGQVIAKTKLPPNVPPVNKGLWEAYRIRRKNERDEIIQRHIRKQKNSSTEWRAKYNAYLNSPDWRAKRAAVLKRAGGICEGCGSRPATQAHHRTYSHVFEEFLFELVALCDECHDRIHQDDRVGLGEEWSDEFPCAGCRWGSEKEGRRWCAQFEVYTVIALSSQGRCGPKHSGFEPLK
jgi:hypothetical protein